MDAKSQELFDTLVKTAPEGLNAEEQGFLIARRDYMNAEQREKFSSIIDPHEKALKAPKKKGEKE